MTETFRSLTNYKAMHQATAKKEDVLERFNKARTLTEARKILFGVKGKGKALKR